MAVNLDRRSLLKLIGAGAVAGLAAPAVAGCGGGSGDSDVGNAGKDLAPWPKYLPFAGPKPDSEGDASGVQPLYLKYPDRIVQSVAETVGDGSDVTALVISYGVPPKAVGENQFWQAVNKALGINLKIISVPDADYTQKMATLMAGDDLPDIIMFSNSSLPNSQEFIQAKCADLSELIGGDAVKPYPNIANIPPYAWEGMGRIGGKIYGVPLERPMPANNLFVNRTAMDQAGIPKDWNTDQFVAALKQLSGPRRWGLGAAKTQFNGLGAVTYHAGSMGAPNTWSVRDGAFVHTITTPQFEAAIGVMRKLVEAGAVYPDSLTVGINDMKNYFHNGTVSSMTDGFGALAPQTLTSINGRFALDLGRPYGPNPTPWRSGGIFGYTAFKKASNDRLKLLLRVVNFLGAPFGTKEYELVNYGVEGTHFTRSEGGIKTTDLFKVENNTNLPIKYIGAAPGVLYLPGQPDAARAAYEWEKAVLPKSVANPANGLRSATWTSRGAQLDQIVGDGIAAIAFGRKPASSWKDIVNDWRQSGGDQAAAEFAKEYTGG